MIDIDSATGATIRVSRCLSARFIRLLGTHVAERVKRRGFGNPALAHRGALNTEHTARIIQNLTFQALADPINGLIDFTATACNVLPTRTGFFINVSGVWNNTTVSLQGVINGT